MDSYPDKFPRLTVTSSEEVEDYRMKKLMASDREYNFKSLPIFLKHSFLANSTPENEKLPLQVKYEPYSYYDGVVEDTPSEDGFLFTIDEDASASVRVGKMYRSTNATQDVDKSYFSIPLPEKRTSSMSIVYVYRNYGLNATYRYMEYLYYHKYNSSYPMWLELYLLGSLAILQREAIQERLEGTTCRVLYLCSRILSELLYLDNERMLAKENAPPISVCEMPSFDELRLVNSLTLNPVTITEDTSLCLYYQIHTEMYKWSIRETSVNTFSLSVKQVRSQYYNYDSKIVQYSIHDYSQVFKARKCANRAIISLLQQISINLANVTEHNKQQASAWIVQLSYDTSNGIPSVIQGLHNLGVELQRLIRIAIQARE